MHVSVWILNICLVFPNSLSLGLSAQIQVSTVVPDGCEFWWLFRDGFGFWVLLGFRRFRCGASGGSNVVIWFWFCRGSGSGCVDSGGWLG